MIRIRSLALVLSVFVLASCRPKPSEEEKKTPAQVASNLVGGGDESSPLDNASALPALPQQEPWNAALCNVLPEADKGASFSDLKFEGTCAFEHHGPAQCRARGDDYYAILRRTLADGSALEIYLNVEFYTGPGTYDRKVEILALVKRGQSLYRWSNVTASVTLGFAEGGLSSTDKHDEQANATTPTKVTLPTTELTAEPGTATSGKMVMSGTIGCVLKPPPGRR